jgi:hypothetical protein
MQEEKALEGTEKRNYTLSLEQYLSCNLSLGNLQICSRDRPGMGRCRASEKNTKCRHLVGELKRKPASLH